MQKNHFLLLKNSKIPKMPSSVHDQKQLTQCEEHSVRFVLVWRQHYPVSSRLVMRHVVVVLSWIDQLEGVLLDSRFRDEGDKDDALGPLQPAGRPRVEAEAFALAVVAHHLVLEVGVDVEIVGHWERRQKFGILNKIL